MTKRLTGRTIRNSLRDKKIPVVRTMIGAKLKCRARWRKHGNPQWAFAEKYGFVILDKVTVQLYNRARLKNNMKPLRIRNMDAMCVFRHPRVGKVK